MTISSMRRFVWLAAICSAYAVQGSAQSITATPESLTLPTDGSPVTLAVGVSGTTGNVILDLASPHPGISVSVNGSNQVSLANNGSANASVRFVPNTAGTPQNGNITLRIQGTNVSRSIPFTVAGATSGALVTSVSSVTLQQAESRSITVSGGGTNPSYIPEVQYTSLAAGRWLTVQPAEGIATTSNQVVISANTLLVPGTYTATLFLRRTTGSTATADAQVQVTLIVGSQGTSAFYSDVTAVTLNSSTATRLINLSSTLGAIPQYIPAVTYTSGASTTWLQVLPALGAPTTSSQVQATANLVGLTAGEYRATLTLTPTAGYTPVSIPIALSVGTAGGTIGSFTTSPTFINLNVLPGQTAPVSQQFQVSSGTNTEYTLTLSSNLSAVGIQATRQTGFTPDVVTVTALVPAFITSPVSGTLTISGPSGSALTPTVIPVSVNGGVGGGTGSVVVNPQQLTFNETTGTSQTLSISSSDSSVQSFSVTTSSTNDFLTVSIAGGTAGTTLSGTTPGNITVAVDTTKLPATAGPHTATLTITPLSGIGAGFPLQVPVTVNITSSLSIRPNVLVISNVRAGEQNRTATVQLSTGGAAVVYSTTATVTSGAAGWLSVEPATGTAAGNGALTPATIRINAQSLTPGRYSGTVSFNSGTVALATLPVDITVVAGVSLTVAPASLTFQQQTTSTDRPPAQVINIGTTGDPISFTATAEVTTAGSGNWLSVTPASGTTPNTVSVSVNPTGLAAGRYEGRVRITSASAANSPQDIPVVLVVTTPPAPQIGSVVNAASFTPTSAAPGTIITITGTDLGPATPVSAQLTNNAFPTTLGNVRVLFDGIPAPLLYVSTTQISAVAPWEIGGRFSVRVVVEYQGGRSRELELRGADAAPGIFTSTQTGSGQAAVLNQNFTVNSTSNPADRGNYVVIYATGFGPVNPIPTNGSITPTTNIPTPIYPIRVEIGGQEAEVAYAGPAPGLVAGAMQINARVPAGAGTGAVSLRVVVNGIASQNNVTIAVR